MSLEAALSKFLTSFIICLFLDISVNENSRSKLFSNRSSKSNGPWFLKNGLFTFLFYQK